MNPPPNKSVREILEELKTKHLITREMFKAGQIDADQEEKDFDKATDQATAQLEAMMIQERKEFGQYILAAWAQDLPSYVYKDIEEKTHLEAQRKEKER